MDATHNATHYYAVKSYGRGTVETLPDRFPTIITALVYVGRLPRSGTYEIVKLPITE